MVVRWRAKS